MKNKRMLIVGNPKSIHTIRLSRFFEENYQVNLIDERIDFSFRNFFSALKEVKKILSCNRYDILVLYQLNLTAFVATLANRKKKIPTFAIGIGSDILTMPKKGWAYKAMLKYILKRSQAYNAGSPYLLEQMQRYCPKNSEILLANLGINPIQPIEKENIVFSNRLHSPLYRIDEVIKAFAKFVSKPEFEDWRLVVAATGREKEFQQLAHFLGIEDKVKFVGWLSQKENAEYYAKSKIYISLPKSDSFPISLLEAMSGECLCIVSDLPAYKGIMKQGENCLIVSDLEIEKADYIERVLELDSQNILQKNKTFA
ncbi:MAG: glycosyltransferase family 4 protein, partial [Bacteroidales bacterium]|nr:glycosyltransferase family 4 protein [Bacteroidales bacterium]